MGELTLPTAECDEERPYEGHERHCETKHQGSQKSPSAYIQGQCRENACTEDAGDQRDGLPEVKCRPRTNEAAKENGNRGQREQTGGSTSHALSSVLSSERQRLAPD